MSRPFQFRAFVPAILVLFAISAALRWSKRDEILVTNIDASYHVLLTVRALNETPASIHHFLPTVTLGRELDRDVPFGATMRGPRGVYYYTSFPPLGFVAPWAFFRVTGLAPSIEHLLVFSLVIHLVATFLIAFLIIHDVDDNYFSGLLAGEVASRIHSLYDVCRTRFGG